MPGSVHEAVGQVFDEFEENGDRIMWMLANEHRVDGLAAVIARGRAIHRERVTAVFADRLTGTAQPSAGEWWVPSSWPPMPTSGSCFDVTSASDARPQKRWWSASSTACSPPTSTND